MSVPYTIIYCRICRKFQAVPAGELKCPKCASVDPNQMILPLIKKGEKTIFDTLTRMVFDAMMENADEEIKTELTQAVPKEEKNKDLVLKQKNNTWKTRLKSLFKR